MYFIISLLIIIPFLLFSLLISYIYGIKLEHVITESLQSVANAQIAEMTGFCEQQLKNLTILGETDITRAALRGDLGPDTLQYLDNMLSSRVQTTSYLTNTALIDTSHQVVACSEETYASYANKGFEALVHSMGGQNFYISDILHSNRGGKAYKSVAALMRIKDKGEDLGFILAEIDLDFYNQIRARSESWSGSTFYLLDGKEQIISAGTSEDARESFVTTEEERKDYRRKHDAIDFKATPKGSFAYQINGHNYITYYSDIEYTDWRIMLSVNTDSYMAQQAIYGILAFFLALLCAALAIFVGAFTSRRIVEPIRHISLTLLDIQRKQDYSLRVKPRNRDELGALSVEINRLLDFIETENLYKAKQQRLLQQKAEQDALTKVMNKERINEYLKEAIERHQGSRTKMAVAFVDVDDFKAFNTNYGHNVGDQVLLFLTSLLERELNGTVGRIGGDEFLVIVEKPGSIQSLEACLENVNHMACRQFVVRNEGIHLPITCSIGAVRVDFTAEGADGLTPSSLTKLADKAMYEVKNRSKQGFVVLDYAPFVA